MAVTGSITTRFIDEKGVDLGKTLIEKDYLISVYPNLLNQFDTPMLMTWGYNASGQLGDNTIANKSSPVQTIACGANWKQVSECEGIGDGGNLFSGIKTDGTLWTWGVNTYGQLGDNSTTKRSSPVQTVAGGTNWKQSSVGHYTTAAIKTDGTLWYWGYGGYGGDNTSTNRSSPVQTVTFGTNWKQVSVGRYHTSAVKTDGTLWCWGGNWSGELGNNTIAITNSPVQTISLGTNWKQVDCGYQITAAIKNDGTLWCWGMNTYGELGDSTRTFRSSPVQTIAFGNNWKKVSCGYHHMAAVKNDGTLWTWGINTSGQLGENTVTSRSSPIQTVAYGTNWRQVSAGTNSTGAIKTDGTLWCWGANDVGQLGNNTITNRSSPVQTILYGNNWKSISVGVNCTAAIKDGDF